MAFNKAISDQAMINESLVAEQCVGRWIWKSGKTKSGHGVPWNVQSVNTNPVCRLIISVGILINPLG